MPTAATMQPAGTAKRGNGDRPVLPTVPFIRASAEHGESALIDTSGTASTNPASLGTFDIPAYGYLRAINLLVEVSGGTGTTLAFSEDAPFNWIRDIVLSEPNGSTIFQMTSGYGVAIAANKYGGYRHPMGADPRASAVYSNGNSATAIASTFLIRIPVELNLRDALGSLANQNAAATFKLRMTRAGSGDVVASGTVSAQPTVRVRAYLEAWDQPELASGGQNNQISPPAINTTQFWSEQVYNVSAGQQTIRLSRVGNYLRNLVMVYRSSASRATGQAIMTPGSGNWPSDMTLYLDTRPLDIVSKHVWINRMFERSGYGGTNGAVTPAADTARGLDNGVFVYDFMHEFDGLYGREMRDLWLPTLGSTRLELQGSFGASGTLTVYTNDVAIAGPVFL